MKKIFLKILTIFVLSQCFCFAEVNDAVVLSFTETPQLKTPVSNIIMLKNANQMYQNDDIETSYFTPEEELGESKVEKAFYKFVNDKVVNNKFNAYSMKLGEKY